MTASHDERPPTDYTDALVLYVLNGPRRGMTLDTAMGVIDGINRDYQSLDQWNHALARLTASRLLVVHGGRFKVTTAGRKLVRSARVGSWWRADSHQTVLQIAQRLPPYEHPVAGVAHLTPDEFQSALDRYVARHSK